MGTGKLDLVQAFHVAQVDPDELTQILLAHYTHAAYISPREIVFPGAIDNWAIKFVYDAKNGRVQDVQSGPGLDPNEVDRLSNLIIECLLKNMGAKIGREILFTSYRLTGAWRYGDAMQILPVPVGAPLPPVQWGAEYPCVLEFTFTESGDPPVSLQRRLRTAFELVLVLNSLLEGSVVARSASAKRRWVLRRRDEDGQVKYEYEFAQEGYHFEGFNYEGDQFTPIEGLGRPEEEDGASYYGRSGIDLGRPLKIPADLGESLGRFYELGPGDKDRYLRAAWWFQRAGVIWEYSHSGSYTALVTAMEALMPGEEEGPRCETCGKSRDGPTERFVRFLEKAVPGETVREPRRRLYGLRSALSHGGYLLRSDLGSWGPGPPARVEEWLKAREAWQVARVALRSWLWGQQGE